MSECPWSHNYTVELPSSLCLRARDLAADSSEIRIGDMWQYFQFHTWCSSSPLYQHVFSHKASSHSPGLGSFSVPQPCVVSLGVLSYISLLSYLTTSSIPGQWLYSLGLAAFQNVLNFLALWQLFINLLFVVDLWPVDFCAYIFPVSQEGKKIYACGQSPHL